MQSSVSIADVVARYRPLVKSGKHFKALCPFHDDHSPSLVVNTDQNFAWCFACQNGGDIFSFVQKIEGVSFPESVQIVGEIGGIDTSFLSKQDPEKQKEKKEHSQRIRELVEASHDFFTKQFQEEASAQKYVFEQRKFTKEIAGQFGIGFAEKSYSKLRDHLLSLGYSRKEMMEGGMVKQTDRGDDVIDTFRGRITFPIRNPFGKICGFGARILGDGEPKYLNSPDTLLYDKSKNLFGFFEAKESIRKQNMAVLVEGNLDVISCAQHGVLNTVAISGVGFSDDQAKLLKRFCTRVTLALDSDNAGMQAAERILPTLLQHNFSVSLLEIPGGKDPDEALNSDKEGFISALENAKPAVQVLLERWMTAIENPSFDDRKQMCRKAFPIVSQFVRKIDMTNALGTISQVLNLNSEDVQHDFTQYKNSAKTYGKKTETKTKELKKIVEIPKRLYFWGVIIKFFGECDHVFKTLEPDFFSVPAEKELYSFLQHAYNEGRTVSMREKLLDFTEEFREEIMKSTLFADQSLGNLSSPQKKAEIELITAIVGKEVLLESIEHIKTLIRTDTSAETMSRFQFLLSSLKRFHSSF